MKQAIVFPGQGSQFVGMGKELYETSEIAKEIFDLVDRIGLDSSKDPLACMENPSKALRNTPVTTLAFEGPEEELKRTLNTQLAILAHSLSLAKLAKEKIQAGELEAPLFTAGHSLGEFAALYMADVLDLEDVIKLVAKRAELMEDAPAGSMTAVVGLDEETLDGIINGLKAELENQDESSSVANYNAPDQIVITGSKVGVKATEEAINKFAEEKEAAGEKLRLKVIPLPVGGAFHSPLMQKASKAFAELIDSTDFADAKIPVIQNFSGKAETNASTIKENLKKQMTGSVQWTKTVSFLLGEIENVLELGPGKVLAGLVKKQDRRFPCTSIENLDQMATPV